MNHILFDSILASPFIDGTSTALTELVFRPAEEAREQAATSLNASRGVETQLGLLLAAVLLCSLKEMTDLG